MTQGELDWFWYESEGSDDPPGDVGDFMDMSERIDQTVERYVCNGEAKALQPLTLTDSPAEGEVELLKQLCSYVIFLTTFGHTWTNSHQWDDGGEVRYASLGLRRGEGDPLAPESDHTIAPPPDEATWQLFIAYFLANHTYGTVMKNDDHDVHPKLVELLRARQAELAELGVDIYRIQARINI
jgi:hypothetical protein